MDIIPAILAKSTSDFEQKIQSDLMELIPWVHIDVMNGTFTDQTCISHPSLIPEPFAPNIELHLMVNNPLTHIEEWLVHPSFKRAIVHIEADCDITNVILQTKDHKRECALAISPGTPLERLSTFANHVPRFLVMGVVPGSSGQPFLGEPILERIRALKTLYPNHIIEVDGGISPTVIPLLQKAGAHATCTSSAVWQKETDPITAYKRLTFL